MAITLFQVIDKINPQEYWSILGAFIIGILASRAILVSLIQEDGASFCNSIVKVLKIWDYKMFERALEAERANEEISPADILSIVREATIKSMLTMSKNGASKIDPKSLSGSAERLMSGGRGANPRYENVDSSDPKETGENEDDVSTNFADSVVDD